MLKEVGIYYAVGIASMLFLLLYGIELQYRKPRYKRSEVFLGYFFTRIFLFLMLQEIPVGIGITLVMEYVLLGIWTWAHNYGRPEEIREQSRSVRMLYFLNPISTMIALSGNYIKVFLCFIIFILILIAIKRLQNRYVAFIISSLYPEYVLASAGGFGYIVAADLLEQKFEAVSQQENIPVLLIISLACIFLSIIFVCKKIIKGEICRQEQKKKDIFFEKQEGTNGETGFNAITIKDIGLMVLITGIFFLIALYRLGSHTVPETTQVLQTGNNEMVLDLGEEVELSKVRIFLGYEGKRSLSFSYYDVNTGEWVVLSGKHNIQSVFAWNDVEINQNLRYLGIVAMDKTAYLQEIVLVAADGSTVLPVNYLEYEKAFDEQERYVAQNTYYDQTMFDEVYHGRTAYEFLHKLPIYENTHPPLGKSIISIGIALFGMNPFGFRVMCVIFGSLMIPFMYLFAFRLSGQTKIAAIAAVLLATEFMHFTLSRIATIDIIVAFFVLLMFYFMYCFIDDKERGKGLGKQFLWLLSCGIAMGCAIAVKWTGFYAVAGIAIWFFMHFFSVVKRQEMTKQLKRYILLLGLLCVLCFICIPVVIYVVSYLPFKAVYTDKSLMTHVLENGKLMLGYHVKTVFEHPYSSEWYEWIVNRVSLLDAYKVLENGKISSIATIGSPIVVWGGIPAIVYNLYLIRSKRSKEAVYFIIGYGAMLLPWLLVHRTVFIYQYYICTLFLILLIINALLHMGKKWIILENGLWVGSIVLFIFFYPVISGYPVDYDWVNFALEWLVTWKFAL